MKHRNLAIDLFKYAAALMVIAIHTAVFYDINPTLNFVVVSILCRQAVPFFAVCSGYFLSRHHFSKPDTSRKVFWQHWKKLFLLYGVWSLIYMVYSIPRWIKIGWFSPWAFVDYAIAALTKGSYYHLWYLWGMLCTIPLFYAVLRWFGKKTQYVLTAVLWLLEVSITAYSGWLPDPLCAVLPVLQKVERIICLLPLLLAGALIHDVPRASGKQRFVGFIISFALLFAESLVLRHSGLNAVSYAVFTLPTAYFLFQELLCVSFASDNVLLNKLSKINLFIYCVHPMLVELLAKLRLNSIIHFFLVAISSTALGYLYIKIANKRT